MNNIQIKCVGLGLGVIIFYCSATYAGQQKMSPAHKAVCPEVEKLLEVLGSKTLFDQPPEAFVNASSAVLKVATDVTRTGPSKLTSRAIKFQPNTGSWLIKGSISYEMVDNKPYFDVAKFTISSTCYQSTRELIESARNKIGKDGIYNQTPPPDASESLYFKRKDPDINYSRFIEINASKDFYEIIANRDPSSEGAGG